ncbi:cell division protein FtsL [Anoxybacillus sp. B7M1]|uniref:cell division protein FtsL n=1 Tax=unclassified Anoxybacillus TaxID=2639704 RepID=UPI0005CCBE48|nr:MULTISPECIES: cell division protein FtsL [unclassified Anoxybacillus]ANB58777.1 cell division protein FtsL [Anoxybacillus sp. B2M1]ANB62851.1 cell division protein FtsL [Anoxybacillus sp. B7M1]
MSNTAVKVQEKQQQHSSVRPQTKPKRKLKLRLTLGEKIVLFSFLLFAFYSSVKIISNQVTIYQVNKHIQQLEGTMDEQKKRNNDLYVEVQQLSTYERILEKAKELGLTLNENNVKVVQE